MSEPTQTTIDQLTRELAEAQRQCAAMREALELIYAEAEPSELRCARI